VNTRQGAPSLPAPRRLHRLAALVVVSLVAAAFRFVGLSNVTPPGLEHDEVAHWLINRDILAGNHAIYFTDAYGHEALFHYVQAGFGALAGDNALALRLPAAYSGLLVVALGFALGRRLFGWPSGFWSAAFLAVNLWPVFYSRLALRAIAPIVSYGWGVIPARVRIGETDFATSLFPRDGGYLVPIKDTVRARERLGEGDVVELHLSVGR